MQQWRYIGEIYHTTKLFEFYYWCSVNFYSATPLSHQGLIISTIPNAKQE